MKCLSLLTIMAFSTATFADSNDSSFNEYCKFKYKGAFEGLMNLADQLNEKSIGSPEATLMLGLISSEAKGTRAACFFLEDAANRECVEDYKVLYQEIRAKFQFFAIASGNQKKVDLGLLNYKKGVMIAKEKLVDLKCNH